MGSPTLFRDVGSRRPGSVPSLLLDRRRHIRSIISSSPVAVRTHSHILVFRTLCRSVPRLLFFFPPCLLLTVRTVSVCNCGLSRRLPDSEYSSLKSSHLSVFAFFFRSAFFPGISPPASPRGSPLWITIQFSPNYLVVFRWL